MDKDKALDLALEALEYYDKPRDEYSAKVAREQDKKAITAIKQARALDKKAENARELGLDYEPADGTQVSKVWWDGEKLMAKPIPLVDFYQPMQDSTCNETLRAQGKAYPRTCRKCGKGPCIGAPKPPPAQSAPVQSCYCPNCEAMGKELAALKAQPAPVQEPQRYSPDGEGGMEVDSLGAYVKLQDVTTPPAQQAPVQEPVVFYRCNGCGHAYEQVHPTSCDCMEAGGFDRVEYYTTPPAAQRQWVGLTKTVVGNYLRRHALGDQPTFRQGFKEGVAFAELKLKESNI